MCSIIWSSKLITDNFPEERRKQKKTKENTRTKSTSLLYIYTCTYLFGMYVWVYSCTRYLVLLDCRYMYHYARKYSQLLEYNMNIKRLLYSRPAWCTRYCLVNRCCSKTKYPGKIFHVRRTNRSNSIRLAGVGYYIVSYRRWWAAHWLWRTACTEREAPRLALNSHQRVEYAPLLDPRCLMWCWPTRQTKPAKSNVTLRNRPILRQSCDILKIDVYIYQ